MRKAGGIPPLYEIDNDIYKFWNHFCNPQIKILITIHFGFYISLIALFKV